jgi:hypothetical protein
VAANALGELVGLGATFAVGYAVFALAGEAQRGWAALVRALILAATGAIEGTVVGLAQWRVLRTAFPAVTRRSWWLATLIGALVAWILGSLPSTLIGMQAEAPSAAASAQEPSTVVVLVLAAAMGALLGPVLAVPQWFVLRRHVGGAGRWISAHSLAWAVGMPVIFAGIDVAQRTGSLVIVVFLMAVTLALAGAVVGTIHGTVLVRLAEKSMFERSNV